MKKLYYLPPLILQTLIWIPSRIILKLVFCYKIKGLENLKELGRNKKNPESSKMDGQVTNSALQNGRGGVIFAVNHTNELDPMMVPAALPFLSHMMPMFYVSMGRKFYSESGWRQRIYGGRFFNIWGAYTAHTGLKNYDLSLKSHIEILNDGRSVCIFPEGHKTRNGSIGEGKPGASFLSYRTNSPIVPVKINGLYKPLAQKSKSGKTKLEVIFGKPIYPKDLFAEALSKTSEEGDDISVEEFKKTREVVMDAIREL